MKKPILNVAIVGCGTVGSQTARLLTQEQVILKERTTTEVCLRHIVDVDFQAATDAGIDSSLFNSDLDSVISDSSVDVIVELIGGVTFAKEVIEKALQAGKHVVTANKALLAEHGFTLMKLARSKNVSINFEASCGGGIPIIRALTDGLMANRITALYGILNGTCNYILTAMTNEGKSYQDALTEAQQAGLAEADPTLDVSGLDTAHKLAILSSLAFGSRVTLDEISVTGVNSLAAIDVAYGQELGYTVKLLAIAKRHHNDISLCVRPAFISKEHPLAWVSGPFNAISVYGSATGHTMFYGRGAGGLPTASAVVADIMGIASGTVLRIFGTFLWPDQVEPVHLLPLQETVSSYYIRVSVEDSPGVLAQIAACLGRHDISIRSVLQKEPPAHFDSSPGVPVVITSYKSKEGNMMEALSEIDKLSVIQRKTVCMAIVDEHPEVEMP